MNINKSELKQIIKNLISEMDLSESDIIAKEKSDWKDMKNDFKKNVKSLLKNIEDDDYADAGGEIDKAIKTLKTWKKRITKNISDSTGF